MALTADELAGLLRELYAAQDETVRKQFDRSLPLDEALFDRWERARRLGFGDGTSIYHSAIVFGAVSVGGNTWIGPNTLLDGSGAPLAIGSTCSISAGVQIYTHDTVHWALSGGQLPKRTGAVSIGDCVYIGSQCVIAAGVTIGTRCVISANSLVNDDVADGQIVGGTPARPIGTVVGEGEQVELRWTHKAP
jgi:acetyltransferase-like isoleucine patch superfamily enzyme